MLKCILQPFRGAKEKGKRKGDGADDPKPRTWQLARAQSDRPVPEASASRRCSKMRLATGKTSRADFGSWGMSWMGSMPRSSRAWEIPTTSYDSHPAVTVRSPLLLFTRVWVLSSSADRSHPSGGCRPHSCSSVSIASHTSMSVSCRQRRI
jgi:hypothetical protein